MPVIHGSGNPPSQKAFFFRFSFCPQKRYVFNRHCSEMRIFMFVFTGKKKQHNSKILMFLPGGKKHVSDTSISEKS